MTIAGCRAAQRCRAAGQCDRCGSARAFDALALLAAGVQRMVAIFGVQGWRWNWARDVRELVFALDADARAAARRSSPGGAAGKHVRSLPPETYGGQKDVNEAWVAGTLAWWVRGPHQQRRQAPGSRSLKTPRGLGGRVAIMVADGHLRPQTPHVWLEGLQGAAVIDGPMLGGAARTPDALDGPPSDTVPVL